MHPKMELKFLTCVLLCAEVRTLFATLAPFMKTVLETPENVKQA